MVLGGFFDVIFSPVLKLSAFWAVVILSIIISLVTTLIYKYTTNQNLMKQLKDEMKELQKEAKELKSRPEEAMKVNKKMMETNMKYMGSSLKSTLITFIPIILIFSWMSANFAYEPITPNQDFTASVIFKEGASGKIKIMPSEQLKVSGESEKEVQDGKVSWILRGEKGEHLLEFDYNGEKHSTNVLIDGKKYSEPVKAVKDSKIKEIRIELKKLIVLPIGYKDWLGWLGTYIIFSIAFSLGLRKALKLY
ncbi:DUF106 domain-containing protein [Candidatus Woesearchaeota archaeon]|nr:DUF106 domain-containing protein [Candidatus Woesearchaeota archaeon]MBI2130904.1 DUF106 domain-containing protein [Candidatus Woesearchaeota archaeon]MBI2660926.1 DUF106 domain-containing protein [Candidatus Woesearchaeota archaeon]